MRRYARCSERVCLVVCAALVAGCGEDGGGGRGDAAIADEADAAVVDMADAMAACAQNAEAFCGKFRACDPQGFARAYTAASEVGAAECIAAQTDACRGLLAVSDSATTVAEVDQCARALAALTCETWFGPEPVACLVRPGARRNGAGCSDSSQCESLRCEITSSGCGVCRPRLRGPAASESCPRGACDYGLTCTSADVCRAPGPPGTACAESTECADRLRCLGGVCRAPLAMGEACQHSGQCGFQMDCRAGICQGWREASAGEACGGSVHCKATALQCAGGTCVARRPIGAECTAHGECYSGACRAGRCARAAAPACAAGPTPPMGRCGVCERNEDCGAGLVCGRGAGFSAGAGLCVPPGGTTECRYARYRLSISNNWYYVPSYTIPVDGREPASVPDAGSSPPDAGDAGAVDASPPLPAAPALCNAFAAAECDKLKVCVPFGALFASQEHCRNRVAHHCASHMAGQPDSAWTDAAMATCVAGINAASCAEWNANGLGLAACQVRGPRPPGAGAFVDAQCASGSREIYAFNSCGFCTAPAAADERCLRDSQCPERHACTAAGTCKPRAALGQPCGPDSDCQLDLRCVRGACAKPGTAGQPCEATSHCDRSAGLACNLTTMTCARAVEADVCRSANPDGTVNVCRPTMSCGANGTCHPPAADGQTCAPEGSDGPKCLPPAACIDRRCTLPAPISCPIMRDPAGYPANADPWCRVAGYPIFCPARADQPANCWQGGATCATVTNCAGSPRSCRAAGQAYDCARNACVPACAEPPATASACDQCAARKCCGALTACRADESCRTSKSGALFAPLAACAQRFCPAECQGQTPSA